MQSIKQFLSIIFIVCTLINLLSCTNYETKSQVYKKSGVSLMAPEPWKFIKDGYYKGDRTISFSTGEFSNVSLIIFPEGHQNYKNLERLAYVDKNFIKLLIFGRNKSDYKEVRKSISRSPFIGEHARITFTVPEKYEIDVESYILKLEKVKIIVVMNTEKVDLANVSNKIQFFLSSIQYDPKLSDFVKGKIYL